MKRRKFRHGWREDKQKSPKGGNLRLKNNKTKAFQKRLKTKLIQKAGKGKGFSSGKGKGFSSKGKGKMGKNR